MTHYIISPQPIQRILADLRRASSVGFDLETTGLDPHTAKIRLLTLADAQHTYVFDLFQVPIDPFRQFFEAPEGPVFVGHNLKFDFSFLMVAGVHPYPKRVFDTMLAWQILEASGKPRSLRYLATELLDRSLDKSTQLSDWSGPLTQQQIEYAALDARVVLELRPLIEQRIREAGLATTAAIEFRAVPAITWMGVRGVGFDLDGWLNEADREYREAERWRQILAPYEGGLFAGTVNWDSPQQALNTLRQHGIPVSSTDDSELAKFRDHPAVDALLHYRAHKKRLTAFGTAWADYVNPVTGRIHPDWRQIGAASGRMSSQNPNVQQIPRDPRYRSKFRAPPGRIIVKADYSQIELRIAAQIAKDPRMIEAYKQGEDLHTLTASLVTGKPKESITPSERQMAKALNFGLLYGMGARSLVAYANTLYGVALSLQEAEQFRSRFFQAYQGLHRWHQRQSAGPATVRSMSGRRRTVRRYTESLNTPVQATGADGLKLALGMLYHRRNQLPPNTYPVLAVHDEIVLEAAQENAQEAASQLEQIMVKAMGTFLKDVPVEVDVDIYTDWGVTPWPAPQPQEP